jgi:hypothetical protein
LSESMGTRVSSPQRVLRSRGAPRRAMLRHQPRSRGIREFGSQHHGPPNLDHRSQAGGCAGALADVMRNRRIVGGPELATCQPPPA